MLTESEAEVIPQLLASSISDLPAEPTFALTPASPPILRMISEKPASPVCANKDYEMGATTLAQKQFPPSGFAASAPLASPRKLPVRRISLFSDVLGTRDQRIRLRH
jgi:hypothetical protein